MHLNADIVCDNLPTGLKAHISGRKVDELALSRPEFYEGGGRPFRANRLYVTRGERIPTRGIAERGAVIVSFGNSRRLDWYRDRCCVITLDEKADLFSSFNAIQHVFDDFDAWAEQMAAIVEDDASVTRMLEASEGVLGNAVFAIDANWRILGASRLALSIVADARSDSPGGESLGLGTFDRFLAHHDLSMDERNPFYLDLLGKQMLLYNLHEGSLYRGCLILSSVARPLRRSDEVVLRMLGDQVLRAMHKLAQNAPDGHGSLRQAVEDLVEGIPLDAVGRASFERAARTRRLVCMRLKLSNRFANLPIGYIRNMVETTFPKSITFVHHDNSIVSFIDLDELDQSISYQQAICMGIEPFTTTMGMRAGISDPIEDIYQARLYYLEANIALENGALFNPDKPLVEFQDYALEDMVISAMGELPLELLFPAGLRRLVEHDAGAPTSYIDTLRCYLDNNLSATKTARKLYVHRSTLMERIDRITRELSLDLDDPDVQLHLRMLLKAFELQDRLQPDYG